MRKSKQCPKCGSKHLQDGSLYSHGASQFIANVRRGGFLDLVPPQSDLSATACLTCGFVEFYIKRLDKLISGIRKNETQDGSQTSPGKELVIE